MAATQSALTDAPDQATDGRASEVATVRATLRLLGVKLKAYRFAKDEEGKRLRAETHEEIRQAELRGLQAHMSIAEIHTALGISRQALNNIRKNNPTGRTPCEASGVVLDARLRGRLQELGAAWSATHGTGMLDARESIWDSVLEAVNEAYDAGLTRQETAAVMDISYGQLDRILRG